MLIGSNEKMGTGLNVQERLVAVHHMTPPWRPGDLEQQLGRMLRQGNLFPTVFQFVHVLSGSFDGYTWQLLENKQAFISQIMSGSMTDREVADIGDAVLTFSEIKALASGNPKIMQRITLEAEWQRMKALRDSWWNSLGSLRSDAHFKKSSITARIKRLESFKEATQVRDEATNTEEGFSINLYDVWDRTKMDAITKREEAGARIKTLAAAASMKVAKGSNPIPLGVYRGHTIYGTMDNKSDMSDPMPKTYFEVHDLWLPFAGTDDVGITRSMDLAMKNMDKVLAETEEEIAAWQRDISAIQAELAKPWEYEEKFKNLETELTELDKELRAEEPQPESQTPADGQTQEAPPPVKVKKLQVTNSEAEKQAILEAVQTLMGDPAAKAISERLNGVASREMITAILAMQEMMADSAALARFKVETEVPVIAFAEVTEGAIPVTQEALEEIGAEIQRLQALYDLGSAVQLSLFGDSMAMAAPSPKKRRK